MRRQERSLILTSRSLPTRTLSDHPDLTQIKRQAKELLKGFAAGSADAVAEVQAHYRDAHAERFALHDAQLVLARSYGFASWPKLKAYVEGVTIGRLIDAVRGGDVEQVRAVLRVRPELVSRVAPDSHGHTPLHYAVLGRMPEMVRILMASGADARVGTAGIHALRDAASPLSMAIDRGYEEIVAIVREQREEEARRASRPPSVAEVVVPVPVPVEPESTERSAVMSGDAELLRRMHEQRDLVTPRDEDGWLLRLAVDYDQPEVLTLLLDFGLDPDARVRVEDDDEITFTWGMPLYRCARTGKHVMAEMLLERGADPNAQVYASGTPLSEAYGQRDERMIALLERFGGKSNASMAGLYRRADLARRLLEEHGDTKLPDDGFAAGTVAEQLLGAAARGGDPEILRMALERIDVPHGDPRWNGLLQAPLGFWNHWTGPWCHREWDRGTYLTCFQMLLERSGPPNAPLTCGATILHQIVVMGDHVTADERTAFATAALDAGARLDLRDDLLMSTPLGWACRWGREPLVRLFLDRGANALEPDAEPWATPTAWAQKMNHHHVVAQLREHINRPS
jgi:ankyrin repeat protein